MTLTAHQPTKNRLNIFSGNLRTMSLSCMSSSELYPKGADNTRWVRESPMNTNIPNACANRTLACTAKTSRKYSYTEHQIGSNIWTALKRHYKRCDLSDKTLHCVVSRERRPRPHRIHRLAREPLQGPFCLCLLWISEGGFSEILFEGNAEHRVQPRQSISQRAIPAQRLRRPQYVILWRRKYISGK